MARKKSTQIYISIFWIGLAAVINYIVSFFVTQYITENLGAEAYGFVSLAKTFSNYATIITVALNSFSSRFISIEFHKGNMKKANTYYNSVIIADAVLGAAILLIVIFPIQNIDAFLNVSEELIKDVKLLFLLNFLNFAIVSTGTGFQSATVIKNRLDLSGIFKCISYISEGLVLIVLYMLFPAKLYFVGIALIIASLILLLQNFYATKVLVPELKPNRRDFSLASVKELISNGIWNSINSIGNLLNSGLDLLITNKMLSASQMGQLSIVNTVQTITSTLYSTVFQPFQPLMLKAYADENKKKLVSLFKISSKLCSVFSSMLFAGFAAYGTIYFKLWVPSQDEILLCKISLIALSGGVINAVVHPLCYAFTLSLKNRIPCFVTILYGITNVFAMYIGIRYYNCGLEVVVGTTAVLAWINGLLFVPLYTSHCLQIKKTTFYVTIFRNIMSCIVMTIIFKFISKLYYPSTWMGLIVIVIVCVVLGVISHIFVVFNKRDFGLLRDSLKRK